MAKHDKSGRTKGEARHVRLYRWLTTSAAWRSLDCPARCVYLELACRYDGSNNGLIHLSIREISAALKISKATASRKLIDLIERGFIEVVTPSGFSRKDRVATEYRLTEHGCDRTKILPSKTFMRWPQAQNTVSPRAPTVPLVKPLVKKRHEISIYGPPHETVRGKNVQ